MATIERPKINGTPSFDPYYEAACARIKAGTQDLIDRGIIDAKGNRIRTDLPPDMEEGSERDFGG